MPLSNNELLEWTIDETKKRVRRDYQLDMALQRCLTEDGIEATVNAMVAAKLYAPKRTEGDDPKFWEDRADLQARYIGAERGIRIGIEAGQRFGKEVQMFADNFIRNNAPWLLDNEPEDD